MSWLRRQWLPLTVLVVAVAALIATMAWTPGSDSRPRVTDSWWPHGPMTGTGAGVTGDGPVRDLGDAERAAQRFARPAGLEVGEVMKFDNGFYAQLLEPSGAGATEVLIDAQTGSVWLEPGPAMMWNIAYGMHRARSSAADCNLDADAAMDAANDWLDANRAGETADHPDAFPGYYTLHTERGGDVVGMLSVHCSTGAVWYHGWHGRFIQLREGAG